MPDASADAANPADASTGDSGGTSDGGVVETTCAGEDVRDVPWIGSTGRYRWSRSVEALEYLRLFSSSAASRGDTFTLAFDFELYGTTYPAGTVGTVSPNGALVFDDLGALPATSSALPVAGRGAIVAPMWGTSMAVHFVDASETDRLIITWWDQTPGGGYVYIGAELSPPNHVRFLYWNGSGGAPAPRTGTVGVSASAGPSTELPCSPSCSYRDVGPGIAAHDGFLTAFDFVEVAPGSPLGPLVAVTCVDPVTPALTRSDLVSFDVSVTNLGDTTATSGCISLAQGVDGDPALPGFNEFAPVFLPAVTLLPGQTRTRQLHGHLFDGPGRSGWAVGQLLSDGGTAHATGDLYRVQPSFTDPAGTYRIDTLTLAAATVGAAYEQHLEWSADPATAPPPSFWLSPEGYGCGVAQPPPDWLELTPEGVLRGVPPRAGTWELQVRVGMNGYGSGRASLRLVASTP